MRSRHVSSIVLLLVSCVSIARAQQPGDAYYRIPIPSLTILEGSIPGTAFLWHGTPRAAQASVAIDGPGSALIWYGEDPRPPSVMLQSCALYLWLPRPAQEITGTLVVSRGDGSGVERIRFIKAPPTNFPSDRAAFRAAELARYLSLAEEGLPGSAWFRHQARVIADELGERGSRLLDERRIVRLPRGTELDSTFALLGGGRAISENLQLDRALPPITQQAEQTVSLSTIPGITVAEMDWTALTKDLKPQLDPLAALIPSDQHAIFFPSFEAMTRLIDRAQTHGSLMLATSELRSEDAMTQQRYERQLGLSLTGLGRLLGPRVINSVAITGSDPYLRIGSDLAMIFEARSIDALSPLITAQITLARQTSPTAQPVSGQMDGIGYAGAVAPDRSLCSYFATIGNAVVVTNSLAQLKQIISTHRGRTRALAALPEYVFFRDRYKRADASETALLILSDATIRRWCGPRWRIADSRRTRAAAVMSDLQAQHARELVNQTVVPTIIAQDFLVPKMNELRIGNDGASSLTYGSLRFMTPISELDLELVTKSEAESYGRWRNGYQEYWRQFFDPIACRFSLQDNHIGVDLTIMPLIASTEYRQFIGMTTGAALKPDSADPHPEAIAQLALAINPDSESIRDEGRMLQNFAGDPRIEPLAWLGSSASVYVDEDRFWTDLAAIKSPSEARDFLLGNVNRVPLAFYFESRDSLRLAAFLTMLRAHEEQLSPRGLTQWETIPYGQKQYVKISNPGFSICYAALPNALIVSLNEDVLKRAIDRQSGPATRPTTAPAWLGENVAMRFSRRGVESIETMLRAWAADAAQSAAWSNIPILNEWKRLFPDKDPLAVHQQLFQTRLLDPAGGSYTWNAQWQTMESSNYGHLAAPKSGSSAMTLLKRFSGSFGLTFENSGLRARAEIDEQ